MSASRIAKRDSQRMRPISASALYEPSTATTAPAALRIRPTGNAVVTIDSGSGLPSNQVHKIARDRFSRLWLAGPAGLARFDGSAIDVFNRSNGLRCSGLRSVAAGADGIVWVGTDVGLEALDADGRPLPWSESMQWPYGLCEHIATTGDGAWIGSARGAVRITVSEDEGPRITFHAPIGFVRDVVASEQRAFALSDALGLVELGAGSWKRIDHPFLGARQLTRLALAPDGRLFIGTDEGVLVFNAATGEMTVLDAGPATRRKATALVVGRDELWIASGRTIASVPLVRRARPLGEELDVDSRVNDLHIDDAGNVWIATDTTGLARLSCLRHALRRIDAGQRAAIFSVKREGRSREYWIGGENLLTRATIAEDGTAELEPVTGLPETTVWDTHTDATGLWVATHAGLYHLPHGGALRRVFAEVPVLSAPARAILPRGDELWIGTLLGLARVRGGAAEEVRPPNEESLGYVYALTLDRRGRLWVATLGRGLWHEDDSGRLRQVTGGPFAARGNTYAVAEGPTGELAILQDERVILTDTAYPARVIETSHPVAGWTCIWLDRDTLVIGSSTGLRLLNVRSGAVTIAVRSLLGARDWEFTNNRTLVSDDQGHLLCGVNGGLVTVDLVQLRALLTGPPLAHFGGVRWRGVEPRTNDDGYVVRPGPWSFRARAFSAWLTDFDTLRFRFKLVGFDDGWTPLQVEPEVGYSSLPPGTYELLVQAHSPLSGFGPSTRLCTFRVVRPWWTFGWSPLLDSVSAFYERFVRAPRRNTELIERNRALEQEIAERSAALRARESATRSILESSLSGFVAFDQHGRIEIVNPAAERIFGYDARDILGRRVDFLSTVPVDDPAVLERHIIDTGLGRTTEWDIRRGDGRVTRVEIALFKFTTTGGDRLAANIQDISERMAVERMKREFVSTVSHELRTPLTSIRGSLDLLHGGVLGGLPPTAVEVVDIARRNTSRLVALINDILDLDRLENRALQMTFTPVSLETLFRDAVDSVAAFAAQSGIALRAEPCDAVVTADSDRMIQVLTNLLSNAIKFSSRGTEVELTGAVEETMAVIRVRDRGRGIPHEFHEKIFERFQQVDSSDSRRNSGSGLGLAISRAIVQQHHGTITVDSTEGVGSEFSVKIPLAVAPVPVGGWRLAVGEKPPPSHGE